MTKENQLAIAESLGNTVRTWGLIVIGCGAFIGTSAVFVSRLAKSQDVVLVADRVSSLEQWEQATKAHDAWVEQQLFNIADAVGARKASK